MIVGGGRRGLPAGRAAGGVTTAGLARAVLAGVLSLLPVACGGESAEESARARGDRAFARGDHEEALAEYRLSLLLENPGTAGEVRAAHAYVALGRVDEARALYDAAALADSAHADQAVADFVALAKREHEHGDSYGMASAVEAALHFRPGVMVDELALPLARHYSSSGEHGRARPLYLRALSLHREDPDVILETARTHEEIGDCERALVFFQEFLALAEDRRPEARWHIGSCSYRLSLELVRDELLEEALGRVDVVLALGEPRTLLAQAHLTKAEILERLGDCGGAVAAYRSVIQSGASPSGPLVRRARERIDAIRFGSEEATPC